MNAAALVIDADYLAHQREFSEATFGPRSFRGPLGPLDHLKKELLEIEADPTDLSEWADAIILAFDGALRTGHDPQQIIDAVALKQWINERRTWPDWHGSDPTVALEHVRAEVTS